MTAGPGCCKRRLQRAFELAGILDARAVNAHRARHVREVGVVEAGAEFEQPGGLHFQLDEAEGAVVVDDDLHGQLPLADGEQIAEQHAEPAVARQRDHLPIRKGQLRAMACGIALAMLPWLNEPTSRRRPFIVR